MHPFRAIVIVGLLAVATPVFAQTPAPADGPARVVARLETLARNGTPDEFARLTAPSMPVSALENFALDFFVPGVTRTVAVERDRIPLEGVAEGEGYSLIVEFFAEVGARARIVSARVDMRRFGEADADTWQIVDLERLNVVEGLYRLRMDTTRGYAARNLTVDSDDFRVTLAEGSAFLVESDGGVTGMVLVGRGEMRFTPSSLTEKGQLKIFAGNDNLVTAIDGAYVRLSPADYLTRVSTGALTEQVTDRRVARRAEEIFNRERPKSYGVDMVEVSSEQWFLLPPSGDMLAEVQTRKFGTLTYAKSGNQAEDISLFSRERRRTMSIYASEGKLTERGPVYNEDALADFDITAYEIDAEVDPEKGTLKGRAQFSIRSRVSLLGALTFRLAESLNVTSVTSLEMGRLLFFRIRNQSGVLVNLPRLVSEGAPLTLVVTYSGRVDAQRVDSENVQVGVDEPGPLPAEPSFLLSNRAYWYPQNGTTDYALARLRVTVPDGYGAVATGQLVTGDFGLRDLVATRGDGRTLIFSAARPVRYLSLVISRFVRVLDTNFDSLAGAPAVARSTASGQVALSIEANPRQAGRGREVAASATDIMRFYGSLMYDTPYPSLSIAVVENELPGGHSPAYAVILNTPPPAGRFYARNDPAVFLGFPEFFIAHEVAHQWWGQAVGWNNYHEQWLSEGFAQYFSALYAQKLRGDTAFNDMLRQFRKWAIDESDQGPVYLGYRLGHVKNDSRVFRALVYNKGASVLHMMRRLVGDEAFFNGLRRFYTEFKFQKAGTADLQRAMEAVSGQSLGRFFERWIYGSEIPRVRYATSIGAGEVVIRLEQDETRLFDIPVSVTLTYTDGRVVDVMVPLTSARAERRITTTGVVRNVQVNRDNAALAEFSGL
ncbi:MAG: M1 family aminopeptidase [Vicinamibacterales bacterium]